jgi:hypothetical protein
MGDRYHFRFAPGFGASLMNMDDDRAYFIFHGDLGQLGTIYIRLLEADFPVVKSNVYPGFEERHFEEYKQALQYLYEHQIAGWRNQREALLTYGICTEQEYNLQVNK